VSELPNSEVGPKRLACVPGTLVRRIGGTRVGPGGDRGALPAQSVFLSARRRNAGYLSGSRRTMTFRRRLAHSLEHTGWVPPEERKQGGLQGKLLPDSCAMDPHAPPAVLSGQWAKTPQPRPGLPSWLSFHEWKVRRSDKVGPPQRICSRVPLFGAAAQRLKHAKRRESVLTLCERVAMISQNSFPEGVTSLCAGGDALRSPLPFVTVGAR